MYSYCMRKAVRCVHISCLIKLGSSTLESKQHFLSNTRRIQKITAILTF